MRHLKNNPDWTGMSELIPNIPYIERDGRPYYMDLMCPWPVKSDEKQTPRYPAILFVQGSAWTFPDINNEIPQLSQLSRRGYVVATIQHRSSIEGYPFPAFVEDVKAAIRFLRAHADTYGIDPDRIGLWGTSSGGNAVLLASLTMGNVLYTTDDYPEFSDRVNLVVDCFGPTDVEEYFKVLPDEMLVDLNKLIEGYATEKGRENVVAISPLRILGPGQDLPPYLILHGDEDTVVPFHQSELFYEKLRSYGYDAEIVCIDGADHERDFWSRAVLDLIFEFIDEHMG